MQTPRRYAPMGGSFAPVWVAGFTWNGWQTSAVYAGHASMATTDRYIESDQRERHYSGKKKPVKYFE